MISHDWDRESREFMIIFAIFEERFDREFLEYMTNLTISLEERIEDFDLAYAQVEDMYFQGFLAAWEFLRGITESNDSALEELSKLEPPEWSEG